MRFLFEVSSSLRGRRELGRRSEEHGETGGLSGAAEYVPEAWISHEYMASMSLGDQSMKPAWREALRVRIVSPVRRGRSVRVVSGVRVRDSRITATPWMGSWHMGPCAVASWKACVILSEKSRGERVSVWVEGGVEEVGSVRLRGSEFVVWEVVEVGGLTISDMCRLGWRR